MLSSPRLAQTACGPTPGHRAITPAFSTTTTLSKVNDPGQTIAKYPCLGRKGPGRMLFAVQVTE